MTNTIAQLRSVIDAKDKELLTLLAHRFALVLELRSLKQETRDPERERAMHSAWLQHAERLHLSPTFTEQLLTLVLAESRRLQDEHFPTFA